jgi:hypothetical protein
LPAAAYAANAKEFGIDVKKIILGGWCSRALSTAVISSLARRNLGLKVLHQILMSGFYNFTESYEMQD